MLFFEYVLFNINYSVFFICIDFVNGKNFKNNYLIGVISENE